MIRIPPSSQIPACAPFAGAWLLNIEEHKGPPVLGEGTTSNTTDGFMEF